MRKDPWVPGVGNLREWGCDILYQDEACEDWGQVWRSWGKIRPFNHPFNKNMLRAHWIAGSVVDSREKVLNETDENFMGLPF